MFFAVMRRAILYALGAALVAPLSACAAERGFNTVARPILQGSERTRQPSIWALEVQYKSLRMIEVEITDPKNPKEKKLELIWYLPYRIVNRPVEVQKPDPATTPVNVLDLPPQPIFAPELILQVEEKVKTPDGEEKLVVVKRHFDEIIPEAQKAIEEREKQKFLNTVQIVGPLPALAPPDAKKPEMRYGVAMWRGIDLETDFFSILMSGFSNGYELGDNGLVNLKMLMQPYWRPGDKYDPNEAEIRQTGDPEWVYRPEKLTKAASAPAPAGAKPTEGQ
jgi:hypothetical protein